MCSTVVTVSRKMTYDSSYQEIQETECSRNCTVISLNFVALERQLEANFNLTGTMVWPCILVQWNPDITILDITISPV